MGDIFGEAVGNVTNLVADPANLSPTPAVGVINLGFLVTKEMKGDLKFNRLNATSLPGGVTVPPDTRRGDPTEADFTWRSYMSVVGKANLTAEIRRMVRKNKTPSAVIPLHVRIQRVVGSDGRAHVERFSIGQAVGEVTAWTPFARPQITIEAEVVDEDGCTGLIVYFKWREEGAVAGNFEVPSSITVMGDGRAAVAGPLAAFLEAGQLQGDPPRSSADASRDGARSLAQLQHDAASLERAAETFRRVDGRSPKEYDYDLLPEKLLAEWGRHQSSGGGRLSQDEERIIESGMAVDASPASILGKLVVHRLGRRLKHFEEWVQRQHVPLRHDFRLSTLVGNTDLGDDDIERSLQDPTNWNALARKKLRDAQKTPEDGAAWVGDQVAAKYGTGFDSCGGGGLTEPERRDLAVRLEREEPLERILEALVENRRAVRFQHFRHQLRGLETGDPRLGGLRDLVSADAPDDVVGDFVAGSQPRKDKEKQ